jgi:hypothetical protein
MMPLSISNTNTGEKRDMLYPSGGYSTQPCLPMLKNLESKVGESRPTREPFITLDDCIQQADQGVQVIQKIAESLHRVGEYPHPLAVRKGIVLKRRGVENMTNSEEGIQIKANSRNYFIQTLKAANGESYLRITEDRFKGKDGKRERNSLIIFPENASEFTKAFMKMAAKIG